MFVPLHDYLKYAAWRMRRPCRGLGLGCCERADRRVRSLPSCLKRSILIPTLRTRETGRSRTEPGRFSPLEYSQHRRRIDNSRKLLREFHNFFLKIGPPGSIGIYGWRIWDKEMESQNKQLATVLSLWPRVAPPLASARAIGEALGRENESVQNVHSRQAMFGRLDNT